MLLRRRSARGSATSNNCLAGRCSLEQRRRVTDAGRRAVPALRANFVQLWQRTRQQVAVPAGRRAVLTVGSEVTLAQSLLLRWVRWTRRLLPDIALRVHVDVPQDLINQVASGMVDVAIMYAPSIDPASESTC